MPELAAKYGVSMSTVIRDVSYLSSLAPIYIKNGKYNGITLKDIQVWLGHSDFATTANTYSHLDASSKVSSLNTLSGIISI